MADLRLVSPREIYTCRQLHYHTELIRRKLEFYNMVVLVLRIFPIGVGTAVITVAGKGKLVSDTIGNGVEELHPIVFMIIVCP